MTMWEVVAISGNGGVVLLTEDLNVAIDEMRLMNKRNYNYFVKKTTVQENGNERNGTERN